MRQFLAAHNFCRDLKAARPAKVVLYYLSYKPLFQANYRPVCFIQKDVYSSTLTAREAL